MRIQKVKFWQFRNVPDMEKELNGSNIILLAENTYGKSNFMKGIQAALAGKLGKNAIRNGKDKAEVEVLLNDFDEKGQPIEGTDYTFSLKIHKDKSGQEKVGLEVIAPNGLRETRKTVIGSIAGELELDEDFVALSNSASGKQKQIEIVKSYLDEDTKQILRVEESKSEGFYKDRTEVGRNVKSLTGVLSGFGMDAVEVSKYQNKIDVSDLNKQISEVSTKNTKIAEFKLKCESLANRNAEINSYIQNLEQEIADLKAQKTDNEAKLAQGEDYLAKNPIISIEDLQDKLAKANDHNAKYEKVFSYNKTLKELKEAQEEYENLTIQYETSKQLIADTIRDLEFPIPGITFDSENVYYNGKLVDENNLSTAERMMLDVKFKMQKTPGASVVFIQRGESLGVKMLHELQKEAKEQGFQLIVEQVERGAEELKIELMPEY